MPCSTDHTQTLAKAAVHISHMAEILSYCVIKREGVLESSFFFASDAASIFQQFVGSTAPVL